MEIMKPFRDRIDALDDQITDLLAARTDIIREVARFKHENGIPAVLQDRVDYVRERAARLAAEKGMDADIVRQIYALLIGYSCDLEDRLMAEMVQTQQAKVVQNS